MYKLLDQFHRSQTYQMILREFDGLVIPSVVDNNDYQRFLDEVNKHGTTIVEGDLPESILADVAQKKFNDQLEVYLAAVSRLSQYVLSEGRPEIKEMVPSGEQVYNEETQQYENVLVERVTQTAVEPLPETVEIWEGYPETVKKTVRNPAIVHDEEQRAAAQAIIDATPQEVKDAAK